MRSRRAARHAMSRVTMTSHNAFASNLLALKTQLSACHIIKVETRNLYISASRNMATALDRLSAMWIELKLEWRRNIETGHRRDVIITINFADNVKQFGILPPENASCRSRYCFVTCRNLIFNFCQKSFLISSSNGESFYSHFIARLHFFYFFWCHSQFLLMWFDNRNGTAFKMRSRWTIAERRSLWWIAHVQFPRKGKVHCCNLLSRQRTPRWGSRPTKPTEWSFTFQRVQRRFHS